MVEDSKETPPSQQNSSEAEKKPTAPSVPPVGPPVAPQGATPPRPSTPPPRPPVPTQSPPAAAAQQKPSGRRTFLKALVAISAVLTIIPFVPWGNFLLSSVSSHGALQRQQAVLDLNTTTNNNANGAVAGKTVNVNDLTSFPPNSTWLITYPTSGDINVDSQSPTRFRSLGLYGFQPSSGAPTKTPRRSSPTARSASTSGAAPTTTLRSPRTLPMRHISAHATVASTSCRLKIPTGT